MSSRERYKERVMYDFCECMEHNKKIRDGVWSRGCIRPRTILWVGVTLIAILGFFSHPACDELVFGPVLSFGYG